MNLIELIGFTISFFGLLFLFARQSWEARQRRANPEEYAKEEAEWAKRLRAFMKATYGEEEEEELAAPPRQLPLPQPSPLKKAASPPQSPQKRPEAFTSSIENRHLKSTIENRKLRSSIEGSRSSLSGYKNRTESPSSNRRDAYALIKDLPINRAKQALKDLKSPKEMIILHEILLPPKSLR